MTQTNSNTVIEVISDKLAVAKWTKKINNDLSKIAKMIGESTHVTAKIDIEYTGVSARIFDAAIANVVKYERDAHFILIRKGLTVRLILN
jgi:hypothetical protein